MAADLHAFLPGPGEHLVGRPEVELARGRLQGLPLGLVLAHDDAAFARHQPAVGRVAKAVGRMGNRIAKAQSLAPGQLFEWNGVGIGLVRQGEAGGKGARAGEQGQRLTAGDGHLESPMDLAVTRGVWIAARLVGVQR
jgi:hypothetical protein